LVDIRLSLLQIIRGGGRIWASSDGYIQQS
jgi:hypothetical protein